MNYTTSLVAIVLLFFTSPRVLAATQFEFDGAPDYQTGDYGYYYAVTAGLFPNRTGSPPTPNGDRASGTQVIMHINDDPAAYSGSRWFQDWDKGTVDGWWEDTSGLAMKLALNGSSVYDNNGIDNATFAPDYYGDGHGGVSYSMVNNYDNVTAGYFYLDSAITFNEISGYFIGYGGFDATDPTTGIYVNIFNASISDADPLPDPPLTYSPTENSFTGDVISGHSGATAFAPGTMSIADTGVDMDVFSGTFDIMRGTYTLDTPVTLNPGHYYLGHHAAVAVPEPSAGILASVGILAWLGMTGLLALRGRKST